MLDWYFRIHSWNRIALTGLAVAPAAKATIGTLTIEHLIGYPLGAAAMWAFGWAAIGGRILLRNHWAHLSLLYSCEAPVGSKA